MVIAVPLSRFTSLVGGGSAFFVRQHYTLMKYTIIVIMLGLLATGCSRRDSQVSKQNDAQLGRQIAATWTQAGGQSLTISPDGSFSSRWSSGNKFLNYQGTWFVKDQMLVQTVTNVSGTMSHYPVGGVVRVKIIQVSDSQLAIDENGQTNYLLHR